MNLCVLRKIHTIRPEFQSLIENFLSDVSMFLYEI